MWGVGVQRNLFNKKTLEDKSVVRNFRTTERYLECLAEKEIYNFNACVAYLKLSYNTNYV